MLSIGFLAKPGMHTVEMTKEPRSWSKPTDNTAIESSSLVATNIWPNVISTLYSKSQWEQSFKKVQPLKPFLSKSKGCGSIGSLLQLPGLAHVAAEQVCELIYCQHE